MRSCFALVFYLAASYALASGQDGNVVPRITRLTIEDGSVTVVHLRPGYTTSLRLPEPVSSVVVGNPGGFKAEHTEGEPRLVFLKPITSVPEESNALITTQSGREISLHLISEGKTAGHLPVDFLLEYGGGRSLWIAPSEGESLFVAGTKPLQGPGQSPDETHMPVAPLDVLGQELARQAAMASPPWEGKEALAAAIGGVSVHDRRMLLGFSVLNRSGKTVELLPPQIELRSVAHAKGKRQIKAEPLPISEYRLSTRRLEPGARADGVAVFVRPAFKESSENLLLEVAQAEQVDHPVLVAVPFTAGGNGEKQ